MNWLQRVFGVAPNHEAVAGASALEPAPQTALPLPATRRSTLDLVDGQNALAEYYRFKEAEAYDRGLRTMREHRDFRDDFLNRVEALLGYAADPDARAQIQDAMEKEVAAFSGAQSLREDAATEARKRDSDSYGLLNLGAPLTVDSLKTAYRKAALIHHPDVGGNTEVMQRINDAYELFTAVLRRKAADELLQPAPHIPDVDRFFSRDALIYSGRIS